MDDRAEGEFFTDEAAVNPIPSRDTWDELTVNQLIDLQVVLQEKLWAFQKNPVISRSLEQGLDVLKRMITSRSSS